MIKYSVCAALPLLLIFFAFRLISVCPRQRSEIWLSLCIHGQDCVFGLFMLETAMLSILEWEVKNWRVIRLPRQVFLKSVTLKYIKKQTYWLKFHIFVWFFILFQRWEHDTESLPQLPSTNVSSWKVIVFWRRPKSAHSASKRSKCLPERSSG